MLLLLFVVIVVNVGQLLCVLCGVVCDCHIVAVAVDCCCCCCCCFAVIVVVVAVVVVVIYSC